MLSVATVESHGFAIENNFMGIEDNREYKSSVQKSQTIFGALDDASLGMYIDSSHIFRVGLSYLHEFGAVATSEYLDLVLYYQFTDYPYTFFLGSFPRRQAFRYPTALLRDSVQYYRPCVEGTFYEWRFKAGFENIWIDWTGRQTEKNRETFLLGFSGQINKDNLYLSHYLLYYHYAGRKNPVLKDYLRDNGGLMVRGGYQAFDWYFIDTLKLYVDGVVSYDRIRWKTSWHTPVGIEAGIEAGIRKFGGEFLYYQGIHKEHNEWHRMVWGDPVYTAGKFGKLSVYYTPFTTSYVSAKFILSFYFLEGKVDSRELFLLNMAFGKKFPCK